MSKSSEGVSASGSPRVSTDDAPYPKPAYAWYVLGVLTLVYVFSFLDRQILNLLVVSGVNYFFSLTTIISPYQRQLLFDCQDQSPELWECGNPAGFAGFPRAVERVENLGLVFHAFHGPAFPQ